MWKRFYPESHCGIHVHTDAPVHHGDVAGVDVDADAVSRLGISGTTDGVQTLEGTGEAASGEGTWTVSREACRIRQLTHGDKVHFSFSGFGDGEGQPPQLGESKNKSVPFNTNKPQRTSEEHVVRCCIVKYTVDSPVAMTTYCRPVTVCCTF